MSTPAIIAGTTHKETNMEFCCTGCKHDLPGDCAARTWADDGYPKWPEGDCYTVTVASETTVLEAANQAAASNLHLVIDRKGRTLLTPIVLPGMQKIGVSNKQRAQVAA